MKNLLRLEELAQFLLCLGVLIFLTVPWWCYLLLLLGPDIGMLGYLVSPKFGANTYNLLHHKALAVAVFALGTAMGHMLVPLPALLEPQNWMLAGIIFYGHASLDRIFGYGLKFGDSFQHTHLGWIKGPAAGNIDK